MSIRQAHCAGCGRPVTWAFTPAGERMCFDPEPVPAPVQGTYVIEGKHCRKPAPMFDAPGTQYHMNHWTNCDTPDAFRSK